MKYFVWKRTIKIKLRQNGTIYFPAYALNRQNISRESPILGPKLYKNGHRKKNIVCSWSSCPSESLKHCKKWPVKKSKYDWRKNKTSTNM